MHIIIRINWNFGNNIFLWMWISSDLCHKKMLLESLSVSFEICQNIWAHILSNDNFKHLGVYIIMNMAKFSKLLGLVMKWVENKRRRKLKGEGQDEGGLESRTSILWCWKHSNFQVYFAHFGYYSRKLYQVLWWCYVPFG